MSRWLTGIDAAYAKYESEERIKRVLALDIRYGCFRDAPLPEPITDRDPGDEDDNEVRVR